MKIDAGKKLIGYLSLFSCLFVLMVSFSGTDSSKGIEELCRKYVLNNLDQIISTLNVSKTILRSTRTPAQKKERLISEYRIARIHYKPIEFFIEFYSPFEAKFFINGPLVPKVEMEISNRAFPPQGFQVIEETLFGKKKYDPEVLLKEYNLLSEKLMALKEYYSTIIIESPKLAESLRLELIRIMCLTLNGYDCTINKESITENVYAIEGIQAILSYYKTANSPYLKEYKRVSESLNLCKTELNKNPNSDSFNRLHFMSFTLNPAYRNLAGFFNALKIESSPINYAVNFKALSFFEPNSINKNYFSVYITDTFNLNLQAELGKLLFFDPILSGNNKRACASCHKPNKGFTDGMDKSLAFDGMSKITRNSPTLLNAAYQKLFFHDGRTFNLEEQANGVFGNPQEMNSNGTDIVNKLKQSEEYKDLFRRAYKNKPDSNITFYAVLKSIAEFIKTLDSRNSKFDQYLKGDHSKLNANEINGYNLFVGKALCGSCHFFPLFNGTVPPMYNDNEFEVIGVPENPHFKKIDPDVGRETITHSETQRFAFKTPTIRNIAVTAPYMHNGIYTSLDSILVFYNKGGGAGLGLKLENQTLPFDSLGLKPMELNDIKLFLLALTDTTGTSKIPKRLPKFTDEALNNRKIGGEY